eukprot:771474-Pleurochrysis_carterae.AAC.1
MLSTVEVVASAYLAITQLACHSRRKSTADWNRCRHRILGIRVHGKASSRPRVLSSGKVGSSVNAWNATLDTTRVHCPTTAYNPVRGYTAALIAVPTVQTAGSNTSGENDRVLNLRDSSSQLKALDLN